MKNRWIRLGLVALASAALASGCVSKKPKINPNASGFGEGDTVGFGTDQVIIGYDENGNPTTDVVAFANHEIELLDNRNAQRKKATSATAKANAPIKEKILEMTESGNTYISSVMAKDVSEVMGETISTNKVSALFRQLADEGYFTVVDKYRPEGGKAKDIVKGYTRV